MNKRVTACLVLSPFAFLAIAIEPVKLIVSGADRTIIFALLLIAAEVWLLCSARDKTEQISIGVNVTTELLILAAILLAAALIFKGDAPGVLADVAALACIFRYPHVPVMVISMLVLNIHLRNVKRKKYYDYKSDE